MLYKKCMKVSGLGVLLLTLLWLSSTAAYAQTTVNLCASDGSLTLPNNPPIPIWGFVDTGGGACTPGLATSLPGPVIQVDAGETVVINLTNALDTPTSVVIAGQNLATSGGTPGMFTQQAAANGGTVSYTFTALPGTYLYESGADDAEIQVAMGLYGALIVNSATAGQAYEQPTSAFTSEAVLVLSEIDPNLNANPGGFDLLNYKPTYFLINGQVYPNTATVGAVAGDRVLLRYLNASFDHFAMALLGAHQQVIAKNSFEIANPFNAVVETIASGETMDAIVALPTSPANFTLPIYNRNMYLTNKGAGPGGMRTAITDTPTSPTNQAPSVNAGPDRTITLPASATLSGIASDDGLPTPPSLTVSWSQVSGPGTATFANPSAAATTASFSQAGVYTLRLTASDGALTSSDDLIITVNPANQPPTVSAGDDQTITLPSSATLDGTVTDDGLPTPPNLTTSWSQVSGPGTTTFGDANAVDTTADFSVAGVYTLRLTANDGAATVSDDVTVTVNPAPVTGDLIYVSSSSGGTVGGVAFQDEDILVYDTNASAWSMLLDLSDVSVNADVDAFAFINGGNSVLLSFDAAIGNFPGPLGAVDDSDILLFTPTTWGGTTAGTFSMFFDGSDVGLSTNDEDIDALHVLPDGRLLISTLGAFSVPGATGNDEDILIFTFSSSPGAGTTGSWELYFDGSDVGLTAGSEDIWGLWSVGVNADLYLSTSGNYAVLGLSGDNDDIFVCTPGTLGDTTTCTFSAFWDGNAVGYGAEQIDGIALNDGPVVVSSAAQSDSAVQEANTDASLNEADDEIQEDINDSSDADRAEERQHEIFLPVIQDQ